MTLAVEILEHRPDTPIETQLVLDGSAFEAMVTMATAGLITPTSLTLDNPELPFESYEDLGRYLGRMNRSLSWWVGDWLVFGEGTYGERYAQALAATGLSEGTLLQRVFVAKAVPASRRRAALSFSVHAVVARLQPTEQTEWLKRAEQKGWGAEELRDAMKAKRREERPTLLGGGDDVDLNHLKELVMQVVNRVEEDEDGAYFRVRREDVAQLRAAVGLEE